MDDRLREDQNLLIKYRNLMLISNGINPKLYFIYLNYFNKNYLFKIL